jgi:hypothetical protein
MCLVAAAALRFFHLDFQSLWLDELFSVVFSHSDLGFSQIAATYADDVHPLGYPLLLHAWLEVFGDTDFSARALSAALGVLGVAAMFAAGRGCFDTRTGVVAAVVTTFNPFHIAYSQEARAYSLVFLLAALSYWAFISVLQRPGWKTAVLYGLINAAAIHVHYYAFLVVFGQLATAMVLLAIGRWNCRRVGPLFAGAGAAGLTLVAWLQPMLKVAEMRDYWPARPTPSFILEYFHEYFGNQLVLSLICGGLVLALPFLLSGEREDAESNGRMNTRTIAGALGLAVAIALLAAYLRSVLVVPMLIPRVTIVFLPVLLLLVALAISRLSPPRVGVVAAAGLAVVSVFGLFRSGYYGEPRKEQWREAARWVLSDPRLDEDTDVCLATLAPGFQYYFDQYGSRLVVEDVEELENLDMVDGRPDVSSVWLLVARDEDSVQGLRRELRKRWVRTDRVVFLGTSVERWEQSEPSQ